MKNKVVCRKTTDETEAQLCFVGRSDVTSPLTLEYKSALSDSKHSYHPKQTEQFRFLLLKRFFIIFLPMRCFEYSLGDLHF